MAGLTRSVADEVMTTADVADFCKVPASTVEQWRWKRTGPPYSACGRHVRYLRSDVEAWLRSRRVGAA
jgi:hypothetical protein